MTTDSRTQEQPVSKPQKTNNPEKRRSVPGAVYDSLASVTLAISLLITLAATSIVGTVVLQQGRPEQYLSEYGQGLYRFFQFLDLDNMYRSWWFLTLLVLLLMNITLCSIKRFPRVWRVITQSPKVLDEGLFRRLRYRGSVRRGVSIERAEEEAREILDSRFGKVREERQEDAVTFYVDRGWYGRIGSYVVHLSILILAVGAIYGGLVGFKGYVVIVEGQTIDRVPLRGKNSQIQLPFSIRCDDFQVIYYPGSQQPKDYYSDLVVLRDGIEVQRKRIEVNHPLIVDGIYFYQSSYGIDQSSTVTLDVLDPSGKVAAPAVKVGARQTFNVLGDPATYAIEEIYPTSVGGQPAVKMNQFLGSGRREFFLAKAAPDRDRSRGGAVYFRISDTEIREYTGLQVAWDPGVNLIWLACFVMMLGLYVTFFVPHRRVWVRIDSDPDSTAVLIAGSTSRNPIAFERDFEGAMADLKEALKGKRQKG